MGKTQDLENFLALHDSFQENKWSGNQNINYQNAKYYSEVESKLGAELRAQGRQLMEKYPDDREVMCVVYSAMPIWSPRFYEHLSDDLKNDKLVTMLALQKFDESSYGRVGETLRGDKETMYLLANQTSGEQSITQFSPSLLADKSFWVELIGDANVFHLINPDDFESFIYRVNRINEKYKMNINMGVLISAVEEAKRRDRDYRSPLEIMGPYAFWVDDPRIIRAIANGNENAIQKYVHGMLREELLEAARQQVTERFVEVQK